ncbi:Hypothetical predicted protein, partial [Mytilus galloprovincialis]
VCVYIDGSQHSNGSHWYDGCDHTCECEDSIINFYNCTARCKAYSSLPSICTLKQDPADSCCQIPDCGAYTPITGNKFTGTIPPKKFNLVPIGTHSVFYGSRENPNALQGVQLIQHCHYTVKKKEHVPGQCCQVLSCDIPGFGTMDPYPQLVPNQAPTKIGLPQTPAPTSLVSIIQIDPYPSKNITGGIPGGGYPIKLDQIAGISNQCVYKNKVYNKGESWDIDCDFTCTCVDGSIGYYECKPRCPTYNNLPSQCFTTTVQGKCCKAIQCVTKDGSIVKPNAQFPVVGSYTGGFSGFRPGVSYKPESTPTVLMD